MSKTFPTELFSPFKKGHLPTMVMLIILVSFFLQSTECQSSQPIELYKHPLIESRVVTLTSSSTTTYEVSVTFSRAFPSIPSLSNTFYGIQTIKYMCNYHVMSNRFKMYTEIVTPTTISQTGINFTVLFPANKVKQLRLSMLIFAQEYQNLAFIQSDRFVYTMSSNQFNNVPINGPNPIVMPHVTTIEIISGPNGILTVPLSKVTSGSNFQRWELPFPSGYYSGSISVVFLIIYPDLMPTIGGPNVFLYTFSAVPAAAFPSGSQVWKSVPEYEHQKSSIFSGIRSFRYIPQDDPDNRGVYWQVFWPTPTNQSIRIDGQTYSFHYISLVINSYGCPNITFPFKFLNTTTNQFVCLSECPAQSATEYSIQAGAYVCNPCSANCLSCTGISVCQECMVGYQLDENFTCVLKSGYFTNSTGVYLCSVNVPNCRLCTPDGLACLWCGTGFAIDSTGTCKDCTSVVANCKSCTLSICVLCLQPYLLISPKLCSIEPFPTPPQPQPSCTSNLCQACNPSNLSQCLTCKSNQETVLTDGTCVSILCGDGKIDWNETCDDGNTENFDGCSVDCTRIEDGFRCDSVPKNATHPQILKSDCYFNSTINVQVKTIIKLENENKVQIILENLNPNIRAWAQVDNEALKSIVSVQFPQCSAPCPISSSIQFFKSSRKSPHLTHPLHIQHRFLQSSNFQPTSYEHITILISYTTPQQTQSSSQISLNHHPIVVTFTPSASNLSVFKSSVPSHTQFDLLTQNNQIVQFYDFDYYKYGDVVYGMSMTVSVVFITMMVLAVVLFFVDTVGNGKKVWIVIEAVGIVQFTYFSLVGVGELNPLFVKIVQGLKYSSGFDLHLTDQTTMSKRQFAGIQIDSQNLSNNVNISLIIVYTLILVAILLFVLSKLRSKFDCLKKNEPQTQQKITQKNSFQKKQEDQIRLLNLSKILLRNFAFALFLFFLPKIMFFLFVQFSLGRKSIQPIDSLTVVGILVVFLVYVGLLVVRPQLFSSLLQKIKFRNHSESEKSKKYAQKMESMSFLLKKLSINNIYPLLVISTHFLNSLILVTCYQSLYWNICPLIIHSLWIAMALKYSFHDYANKIRFIFNNVISIVVQSILMARHITIDDVTKIVGGQEKQLGVYLPFTIVVLLLLMAVNSLVYFVYSIKRLRCCDLDMEWEKQSNPKSKNNKSKAKNLDFSVDTNSQEKCLKPYKKLTDLTIEHVLFGKDNQQEEFKTIMAGYHSKGQYHMKYENKKLDQIEMEGQILKQNSKQKHVMDACLTPSISNMHLTDNMGSYPSLFGKNNEKLSELHIPPMGSHLTLKKQIKSTLKNSMLNKKNEKYLSTKQFKQPIQPIYKYTDQNLYNTYEEFDKI